MEQWKDIPGFKHYQVSNEGRVRSLPHKIIKSNGVPKSIRGGILKPRPNNSGYLLVPLFRYKDGGTGRYRQQKLVHRLVAEAFIPNPDGKPTVNHRDEKGDKTDNRVENLEWATHKEQEEHAKRTGLRKKKPPTSGLAILTEEQVLEIRKAYESKKESMTKLGKKYGVSRKCISKVVNRLSWKNI
jgi:hypothetical protein